MRRTIGTYEASTINSKTHWQILQRNVVHNLVVSSLKKRRVYGTKWRHTLGRKTSRKRHGMLFGYADVEETVRKTFSKAVQSRTRRHCGRNSNNLVVAFCFGNECIGKHASVAWWTDRRLYLLTGNNIEFGNRVSYAKSAAGVRDCDRRSGRCSKIPIPQTTCRP